MISTADYQTALEPIARKNFFLGVEEIPAELKMFYDVFQSDKLTETYLDEGDVGDMEDLTGSVSFDEMKQEGTMTITAVEKAKGMKIQRKFLRTDQLDIARTRPKMLGLSANRRIATDIFYPFAHAFDGLVTTIDGLSLCNTAHTSAQEDGVTQGNSGTSAFNAVSLSSTRVSMVRYLTNRGNKFRNRPDTIICATDLLESVWEVVNSIGKVDGAMNNKNFHANYGWNVIDTPWLDDTNNWFVVDSKLMKQFMRWNVLDKLDFKQAEEFSSYAALYSAYMFYGFGVTHWAWLYGHSV